MQTALPVLQKLLYSKAEAAHLLSLSPRTIDNLIVRKELKPTRIGRKVLFHARELVKFASGDHDTIAEAA